MTGAIISNGTAGIGYNSGSGGFIQQSTSKVTLVTLNKIAGQIQTAADSLAKDATAVFQLNNTTIAENDVLIVNRKSGGTDGAYRIAVDHVGTGHANIAIRNTYSGPLSESINISFAVIKSSNT